MTAGQSRKIWLTRHGESCFNMAARIGGDSGLTARGEEYARLLPDVLESRLPAVGDSACTSMCAVLSQHSTRQLQDSTKQHSPMRVLTPDIFQWWVTCLSELGHLLYENIGGDNGLTTRREEYALLLPDVLESWLPAVGDAACTGMCALAPGIFQWWAVDVLSSTRCIYLGGGNTAWCIRTVG
jgi:hypothetical protein